MAGDRHDYIVPSISDLADTSRMRHGASGSDLRDGISVRRCEWAVWHWT